MKNLIITLLGFIIALSACESSLTFDERGIMQVNVYDEWGQPQPNVNLVLYRTVDDWAFDENRLGQYQTDINGAITIPGLAAGEYYFDAVSDQLNNWQDPYPFWVEDGSILFNTLYLRETVDGYISNAAGIDWRITEVLDESGSPDASRSCEVGNIVTFTRAGAYEITDTSGDCGTGFVEGSWWGIGMGEVWLLLDEGTTVIGTSVSDLNDSSFRLTYFSGSDIVTYVYEKL